MNYYEHHLGDYAKDTAHLTMLEDGAYRRLLDRYYGTEMGIPADQAHRVARARTRDEKAAVDAVLEEFFTLDDGIWKNSRAEEEIAKFAAKKPKAEEKRENDKERQRRARERRKALFEELSALGVHMAWNATTDELHAALDRAKSRSGHDHVTPPVTRDNTATQTPDTRHQVNQEVLAHASAPTTSLSPAGAVCARLKSEARVLDVNPSHPKLLALLGAGLTEDELIAAGHEAHSKGKGFAYALGIAEGRRRDADAVGELPRQSAGPPGRGSRQDRISSYIAQNNAHQEVGNEQLDAINGTARRVPGP